MKLVIALLFVCGSLRAQCPGGYALQFDGNGDYVQIADAFFGGLETNSFTVECWFQTTNDNQQYGSFIWNKTAFWQEAYLSYCCDRSFSFLYAYPFAYNNAYVEHFALQSGQWHHIAASMESSTLRLFLDGQMIASSGTNGTMSWATDAGTNRIGSGIVSGNSYYFDGLIDEMRFSSVARYTENFSVPTEPFVSDQYTEALYHFDEGSGSTLMDASGNSHNGTLVNNPQWIACDQLPPQDENCPGGSALLFNGCSNYVMVPNSPSMDLGNQLTVECWYRRDGGSCNDVEYFLTKFTSDHACPPTGWYLRAGVGGANIGGGLLQPPACQEIGLGCTPGSLATWRHLALSYDGSELRFFVDGQLFASRPESRPIANNTSPLWIGAQNDAYWGRVLNGALDEVRISSVARYTSDFIPQRAQFETDQYTVCLYHFDEGSGSVLNDASGNENHGTLINNPQWICSDAPLPVELLSFTATPSSNRVTLYWSTGSESNVSHFEIDRDGNAMAHVDATNNASGHAYTWLDDDVANGQTYSYTLTSVDLDGSRTVLGTVEATPHEATLPTELTLAQNYPNPFNASTTIEYSLPEASNISLKLFNLAGQEVAVLASGSHAAGRHVVSLNASDLSSGIYFYRLESPMRSIQQKMVLLK